MGKKVRPTNADEGGSESRGSTETGEANPRDEIRYETVDLPDNTDYVTWSFVQRRAWLLREIRRQGSPKAVNGAAVGRKFGVSRHQIYKDLDILAEYIASNRSKHASLTVDAIVRKSLAELMSAGDYKAAINLALEWERFLLDAGYLNQGSESEGTGHDSVPREQLQTDDYQVIVDRDHCEFPDEP